MSKNKTTDRDLISLEASLPALEQQQEIADDEIAETVRPTLVYSPAVYYYLIFLVLIWILGIIVIINFSIRTEPASYLVLAEDHPPSASGKTETKVTAIALNEVEAPRPVEKVKPAASKEFHFYTPEELQKIADKISSNPSRENNIVKAEVYAFLGWYHNLPKLKKDASDFANLCMQDDPQDPRAQRALALALIANGQYERVRVILSGLHPERPDSVKDWMDAFLLYVGGKVPAAMTKFDQIKKNDPSFYPASYMMIQQYLKANQVGQANDVAQFWKAKGLNNLLFVKLMVEIMDRQEQYVEMAYYLNQFEKMYPKEWTILYYLGKANLKLQKKDVAKTFFKRILSAQENFNVDQIGKAYFEMGKIALLENSFKNSIEYLFEASQRIPEDANVRFYLANAYFKSEDYEKAIDIYQQMLVKDQNDPNIRTYVGMAFFQLGQYQSAQKNLELAFNQGSTEPMLLFYLARIEEQKGDINKARDYLTKILAVDPKNQPAQKLMEKLNPPAPAPSAGPTRTP